MTRPEKEVLVFLILQPFAFGYAASIYTNFFGGIIVGGIAVIIDFFIVPIFRDHIKSQIKTDKIINEDILYWIPGWVPWSWVWEYRKELSVIGKMNTAVLNKKELAKSLKNYRGLLNPKKRCKIAFEEICVDKAVRAHKLFTKTDLRDKIIYEIEEHVKSSNINFILLSDSTANNSLKSKLETKFDRDVFSYGLYDGKIQSTIPEAYLEKIPAPGCNIMVVESALFSPRLIYRLVRYLDGLSEACDKNFNISHAVTVFAAKGRSFEIKPEITTKVLVEIDKGIRDGGTCTDCHWGECVSEPEVAKSYMVC